MPLIAIALLGGAIADRFDRRRLLLLDQIALVAAVRGAGAAAFAGDPPVVAAATSSAGCSPASPRSQNVARSAIVPNLVAPEQLRAALALNFGLYQLTHGRRARPSAAC